MPTRPHFSWSGHPDRQDGVATFFIGDQEYPVPLPNFKLAYELNEAFDRRLREEYVQGRADVLREIARNIRP